mgnify:CR=1 FL=1
MVRVHLDTDIGGDIDDLCALALLLRWPDAEITGITTVSEENGRRAGYARYALRLAGREDVAVAAGADAASGRFRFRLDYPDERRYWPEPMPPAPGPPEAALDLLKQSIEQDAIIVGIGPFTNLALLEQRHPGILGQATLYLMGGNLRPAPPAFPLWDYTMDYNVQADSSAAQQVIEASHPTLIPIEITAQTALRRAYLPALHQAGPLGRLIARQAEAFAQDAGMEERYGSTCAGLPRDIINFQHDPLAVATALGWEGVRIERLPLAVRMEAGWLHEEERAGGRPVAVVTAVDGERFNALWYHRLIDA